MPFKSDKQKAYLWANDPEVAKKFAMHDKRKKMKKKRKGLSEREDYK